MSNADAYWGESLKSMGTGFLSEMLVSPAWECRMFQSQTKGNDEIENLDHFEQFG